MKLRTLAVLVALGVASIALIGTGVAGSFVDKTTSSQTIGRSETQR